MDYPNTASGDVFRRLEESGFNFQKEHVVDFFAVFKTEEGARQVGLLYVADHESGETLANVETRPYDGGMELEICKKMLVTYEAVTAFEQKFQERASHAGGYLDGWGVMHDPNSL